MDGYPMLHGDVLDTAAHVILALCPEATPGSGATHPELHSGEPCPYWRAACAILGNPDPANLTAQWRVDLPYDRPPLSLNDRRHWAAHASVVSALLSRTRNAYREADIPRLHHVHVELHYRPATNRFRDVDNIVATLKPCLDALQPDPATRWRGIVPSDDARFVSWSPPRLHRPVKGQGGKLWLILRSSG